jgi:hypothetical protein
VNGLIGFVPLKTQDTRSTPVIGIVFHDKRFFNPGNHCRE